jgi:hypothetical protein
MPGKPIANCLVHTAIRNWRPAGRRRLGGQISGGRNDRKQNNRVTTVAIRSNTDGLGT